VTRSIYYYYQPRPESAEALTLVSLDIQYLVGSVSRAATRSATIPPHAVPLSRNPDAPGVRERRQNGIATSGLCLHAA